MTQHINLFRAFIFILCTLFAFGCGVSRSKTAIEVVLAADQGASQGVTSVANIVTRMRAIRLNDCPIDFREAYVAHIHAWEMAVELEQDVKQYDANFNSGGAMVESFIRGFLGDPFGKMNEGNAALNQLQAKQQQIRLKIQSTFNHVEEIAVRYGASLPPRQTVGSQ